MEEDIRDKEKTESVLCQEKVQKHLILDEYISIQKGIHDHKSLRQSALFIDKDLS